MGVYCAQLQGEGVEHFYHMGFMIHRMTHNSELMQTQIKRHLLLRVSSDLLSKKPNPVKHGLGTTKGALEFTGTETKIL